MAAIVTKYGYIETAKLMIAVDSPAYFYYMCLGTGSQTETTNVQSLVGEITGSALSRVSAATVTTASSATTSDTAKWVHTWTSDGSLAIKECGVFNNSTANTGDMLCYATFASAIPMESADTLKVTWSVQVKAG